MSFGKRYSKIIKNKKLRGGVVIVDELWYNERSVAEILNGGGASND